jgi:hypothetical protein
MLETLQYQQETHVDNLEAALKIIAKVGVLYNKLERSDQQDLLRHMVERVLINPEGKIRLELHAPFAYLKEINDQISGKGADTERQRKTRKVKAAGFSSQCSSYVHESWENCSQVEHPSGLNSLDYIHCITFPQREKLLRFTNSDMVLAVR